MTRGALVLATMLSLIAAAPAVAGEVTVRGVGGSFGGAFNVPVESIREARFRTVFLQKYDFSCGSAALASLLTFHYDRPTTEIEVFNTMYETGDQERIERLGFSLLDMKRYLAEIGLPSDGYKVSLDRLQKAGLPAIALIDTDGYKHFVIVKGVSEREVLVGDPARGIRPIDRDEFKAMWNGIAFVIKSRVAEARDTFNRPETWAVQARAPFGTALSRTSLATFSASLFRAGRVY
ncbi:C39 family peptidase [Ferruginivarius sediminum]|uniref:Peptidase C39 n=1 Tax=Ferruginivarius sediminum TaxID=2661937 RepID=A0A369TDR4_9PROT|nr:C39 family peptidase [Ferruginivarius sediminum]RDD62982.1 peptidase C39 [Ferruginivarius sediminum]